MVLNRVACDLALGLTWALVPALSDDLGPPFNGNIDTEDALRTAVDAASYGDGKVVLVAVSGQPHLVTALNMILQVCNVKLVFV